MGWYYFVRDGVQMAQYADWNGNTFLFVHRNSIWVQVKRIPMIRGRHVDIPSFNSRPKWKRPRKNKRLIEGEPEPEQEQIEGPSQIEGEGAQLDELDIEGA